MLTVPMNFQDGFVLLFSTPTGAAILEAAELAQAIGVATPPAHGAYGQAMDATTLHLTAAALPGPNQACVLAHELTHCLDIGFWARKGVARTEAMTGATEINAHYNQGLVAKELRASSGLSEAWLQQVMDMSGGNSTFGRMFDAWTREDVVSQLRTTPAYGPCVEALIREKILYIWTKDDQWEYRNKLFHCEAHLELNDRARGVLDSTW